MRIKGVGDCVRCFLFFCVFVGLGVFGDWLSVGISFMSDEEIEVECVLEEKL